MRCQDCKKKILDNKIKSNDVQPHTFFVRELVIEPLSTVNNNQHIKSTVDDLIVEQDALTNAKIISSAVDLADSKKIKGINLFNFKEYLYLITSMLPK